MADNSKKNIISEFKEFISRGNVLDMAVGVIVGGAFTSIVTSLVNDIFTPFLGMILAGVNFESLGVEIPWGNRPYLNFGSFIQSIVSFLLTALCVFMLVKAINSFRRKKEEPAPEPKPDPVPTTEELLLCELKEIKELLREQSRSAKPDNNRNNGQGKKNRDERASKPAK